MITDQWIRRVGLFVQNENELFDLSEFKIVFSVKNADIESPNNAFIRIYNLSDTTIDQLTYNMEYSVVTLNAGYMSDEKNYGVIFQGEVRQYRIGKENAHTSYFDILASDGFKKYSDAIMNESIASGATVPQKINTISKAMDKADGRDSGDVNTNYLAEFSDGVYTPSLRGKVLFGLARAHIRNIATSLDASWSIQNNKLVIIPLKGYVDDGQVIEINSQTGMVGVPEQTDEGIKVKCLLNPRLRIGSLVRIERQLISRTAFTGESPIPYNSIKPINIAQISKPDIYRIFVCEHEGDTRGTEWYTTMIGLAFDPSSKKTIAP